MTGKRKRNLEEKNSKSFRFVPFLCWIIGVAVILGFVGACSTEHYKAEADKEAYQIIQRLSRDHNVKMIVIAKLITAIIDIVEPHRILSED